MLHKVRCTLDSAAPHRGLKEKKMPGSQKWITRRLVILLTSSALLAGMTGWFWIRRTDTLQREVEAIGGVYENRNLDFGSRSLLGFRDSVIQAVVNKAKEIERHSININFYKSDLTDSWVQRNAKAMKGLPVNSLFFSRTGITDDALTSLAGMKSLIHLDLAGTSITDHSMFAIREMPALCNIDLTDTDVTEEGISHLVDHLRLKHVDLDGSVFTGATIAHLNAIPRLRELGLKDANNDQLNRLGDLKKVAFLSLAGTTEESLPYLLRLSNIKHLTLVDSALSPDSIAKIRETLPTSSIHECMSFEAAEKSGINQQIALLLPTSRCHALQMNALQMKKSDPGFNTALRDLSLHAWAAVRFVRRREETDCRVVGRPISTRKRWRKFLTRSRQ